MRRDQGSAGGRVADIRDFVNAAHTKDSAMSDVFDVGETAGMIPTDFLEETPLYRETAYTFPNGSYYNIRQRFPL